MLTRNPSPTTSTGPRSLLVALIAVTALTAVDQTIVATALPAIVRSVGGVEHVGWVFAAYTLAITVALPVFGRLGDLLGRRSLFLGSICVFVLASVACGLATSMGYLVAARFVQGLAGAGLLTLSQAVVADAVPARDRARFLAPVGAVFAVASVAGPLLGGWLSEGLGWRWVFWVSAPVGLVALGLSVRSIPRVAPADPGGRFDARGAVLLAVTAGGIVLVSGETSSAASWWVPACVVVTVVTGCALVVHTRRRPDAIVPLALLGDRTVVVCSVLGMAVGAGVFGFVGYLPTTVQVGWGLSASAAGSMLLPLVLGMMVTTLSTGRLMSRTGHYWSFAPVGSVLAAGGLLGLSQLRPTSPLPLVALFIALLGAGVGSFMQVTTIAVQDAVDRAVVGTATSTVGLVRELGVCVGAAAFGGALTSRLGADGLSAPADVYLGAFGPLVLALSGVFVVSALVALALPRRSLGGSGSGGLVQPPG